MPVPAPLVVGIGGSVRAGSLTEQLVAATLERVAAAGARVEQYAGAYLRELPIYAAQDDVDERAARMAASVAAADAVIIGTPGYHGAMSGLVKNALDHLEVLRADARPYFDGRPVGIVVNAAGWQAVGSALASVRATVHALRGWPTPFAAAVNSAEPFAVDDGTWLPRVGGALDIVAEQVMQFVGWQQGRR